MRPRALPTPIDGAQMYLAAILEELQAIHARIDALASQMEGIEAGLQKPDRPAAVQPARKRSRASPGDKS